MTLLVSAQEYSHQCIHAAYASRLNPYTLHPGEYRILKGRIPESQAGFYLNVRNAILRLWVRNPLVAVSLDEALECVKDKRLTYLAPVAHEWLVRGGYINFGCVDIPHPPLTNPRNASRQKTVVIIGAGVSGLACARQLQGMFRQLAERWIKLRREKLPRVVILEGRNRIGGRVYSLPLKHQQKGSLPHDLANTAEIGAQIITGFERGNPLNALVRGQLALEYHSLRDNMVLYDHDGSIIGEERDAKIQKLFNDILEAASVHGWKPAQRTGAEGNRALVPSVNAGVVNGHAIPSGMEHNHLFPKINGFLNVETTLGALMDYLVAQHQMTTPLSALDLRLLNWHYANLEYANAVNVDELSLGGWDQDGGNEFEGRHTEIIGGYSQVPRALWKYPSELDVRLKKAVKRISYNADSPSTRTDSRVICVDGETFEADYVVSTIPLGVMQCEQDLFEPSLPSAKVAAIERMGFGVLNKVIFVFESIFWEAERDMFGLLNPAADEESLFQKDYSAGRGRAYLFWNRVKTSGRPMLVALMAGDAARDAERLPNEVLIKDVTSKLAKIFSLPEPPKPVEAIVTRWRKDPFARGSYSYLGPRAMPGDYEAIASPVGNLFFAGEATCGTHPATVHGAYLSGLRVASEVVEAMIGDIPVPVVSAQ